MNKTKNNLTLNRYLSVVVITIVIMVFSGINSVGALTPAEKAKKGINYVDNGVTTTSGTTASSLIQDLINALLFVVGAVSVIMIIIGGIRFVISRGDQQAAADARNTVLYAVIGILVAVMAYGVVNFVLVKLYG